jgi:hypothetical protein
MGNYFNTVKSVQHEIIMSPRRRTLFQCSLSIYHISKIILEIINSTLINLTAFRFHQLKREITILNLISV